MNAAMDQKSARSHFRKEISKSAALRLPGSTRAVSIRTRYPSERAGLRPQAYLRFSLKGGNTVEIGTTRDRPKPHGRAAGTRCVRGGLAGPASSGGTARRVLGGVDLRTVLQFLVGLPRQEVA